MVLWGNRGDLSNWNSHRLNQWNVTRQSKVHKHHGSEGTYFKSLFWSTPSLPFGIIISGSRSSRSSRPAVARTWLRSSSRIPLNSLTRATRLREYPTQSLRIPISETRAKAAGKLTFHLSSYFGSPILTLANEATKTVGGRDLAMNSPCRLGGGGAGGGLCEGRCPHPREPRGLRLRTGRATRARWAERSSPFFTSPGFPSPAQRRVLLPFHCPVAQCRCRCGVGVQFSGRHGWLRIREPRAAGGL